MNRPISSIYLTADEKRQRVQIDEDGTIHDRSDSKEIRKWGEWSFTLIKLTEEVPNWCNVSLHSRITSKNKASQHKPYLRFHNMWKHRKSPSAASQFNLYSNFIKLKWYQGSQTRRWMRKGKHRFWWQNWGYNSWGTTKRVQEHSGRAGGVAS